MPARASTATCCERRRASIPSGLKVIAAPRDMMPLEGMSSEHVLRIVEMATREFGTVFVDLPTNWTNWSLSLVARSDLVVLVTELTRRRPPPRPAAARPACNRRTSATLDVRVVVNRFEKSLARTISLADASKALGRDVSYTVANDLALMRAAIDRGVPIDEIKRKTALGKDLDSSMPGSRQRWGWSDEYVADQETRPAGAASKTRSSASARSTSIGSSRSATPAPSPSATSIPSSRSSCTSG